MKDSELNRRDFQRLTTAALGGLVLGAGGLSSFGAAQDKGKDKEKEKNPLLVEPHVCRGLNTCKEKGAGKENACAGQGKCATVKAHECAGQNECKGQGGCGAHPGENACKTEGECAVPLKEKTWVKARKRFEELMKKEGKKVGPAPKPPKSKV